MSAAEEDTELRDLLIHTLENNGVLSKIKAELRASVFLALEEQEESEPALINERLRQFLATSDGRLLASLVTDFLQHFHLDFTLAVLQPEACLPSPPEERTSAARELGLSAAEAPLLLELLRLHRQRAAARAVPQELPPERADEAQARYRQRARSGEVGGPELRALLLELCPHFHRSMLDTYVTEQLAGLSGGVDEQRFLAVYRGLYLQCRTVVVGDYGGSRAEGSQGGGPQVSGYGGSEVRGPQVSGYGGSEVRGPQVSGYGGSEVRGPQVSGYGGSEVRGPQVSGYGGSEVRGPQVSGYGGSEVRGPQVSGYGGSEVRGPQVSGRPQLDDEDDLEGNSFFDDPIPKPEQTYGWREEAHHSLGSGSPKASDPDGSLRSASEKMAAQEDDYMDDFHSSSQKSEASIGEDLEEELSVDELTASDHRLEELTLDNSISHLSDVADYLEDVS
ncbi:centrosomal protein 43 isoform 2-T2 [Anomaloglossus baeobatrachus]|uniref:centrosomal protein 43 isoform X2 n=1 Tax=Anomaloglossus baeobatrachus TaxID=238106 RepID=UPI003F506E0B